MQPLLLMKKNTFCHAMTPASYRREFLDCRQSGLRRPKLFFPDFQETHRPKPQGLPQAAGNVGYLLFALPLLFFLLSCYILLMTVTQTIDIPVDRRVTIPPEIPMGKVILTFTPASAIKEPIQRSEARDIEIINKNAERLNREAMDVLSYQNLYLDTLDL